MHSAQTAPRLPQEEYGEYRLARAPAQLRRQGRTWAQHPCTLHSAHPVNTKKKINAQWKIILNCSYKINSDSDLDQNQPSCKTASGGVTEHGLMPRGRLIHSLYLEMRKSFRTLLNIGRVPDSRIYDNIDISIEIHIQLAPEPHRHALVRVKSHSMSYFAPPLSPDHGAAASQPPGHTKGWPCFFCSVCRWLSYGRPGHLWLGINKIPESWIPGLDLFNPGIPGF